MDRLKGKVALISGPIPMPPPIIPLPPIILPPGIVIPDCGALAEGAAADELSDAAGAACWSAANADL